VGRVLYGPAGMGPEPPLPEKSGTTRLSPLDALRGMAAILIAGVQHYQHFGGDKKRYPFASHSVPAFIYEYGWLFVDFFFVMSGVVFTHRYLEPIARRRVTRREFFVLRLSRLYPLHVLTLVVCATVEWTLMVRHKPPVIYDHNDVAHFVLQLLYLQTWFAKGFAYNEPSWSVAAEVFVYGVFFVVASRYAKAFVGASALIVFVGVAAQTGVLPFINDPVARALTGFFVGALVYHVIRWADAEGYGDRLGWGCLGVLAIFVALGWFIGVSEFVGLSPLPYGLFLFPLAIVASLKVRPLAWALSARPLTYLGDVSYSVYLVHVPLQMIVLATATAYKVRIPTEDARVLATYVATVIAVGSATYFWFERPAQKWLRERWLERSPQLSAATVAAAGVRAGSGSAAARPD
jgi:peptidoglycan/LPS O-acetylase OafA/YrhL